MRVTLAVSFEAPPGADRADCQAYVLTAVRSWKGETDPDDPVKLIDRNVLGAWVACPELSTKFLARGAVCPSLRWAQRT
jgi:hypothetical protein